LSVRQLTIIGTSLNSSWLDWKLGNRVRERKLACMDFLENHPERQASAFWRFFQALSERTGAKVIWTNLAKIGVTRPSDEPESSNPFGKFLSAQKELAAETVLAEIEEYEPDLVVLLTGGDRPYKFGAELFAGWGEWSESSINNRPFQFMGRTGSHPAVLLVAHPGWKQRADVDCWVEKARQLLAGSLRSHTRRSLPTSKK
jgi:hypothetical protein